MLADIKILDFTTHLPGPFAAMYLGDLGVNILQVEALG
ncbi:MAG: CoA transferase [Candidatus Heimdallarchaeota archaeon]|nr:CoA transferase [Candidatus Heimdallarchaeota archaeon]